MHFHITTHASQLLGRDVDINKLLAQRLNASLKQSLNAAITRFESNPVTSILV